MVTELNEQPMMEIPIADYEALIASCAAWREWADEMERGLIDEWGDLESFPYWIVECFDSHKQPQTDKEGILLKLPRKGKS